MGPLRALVGCTATGKTAVGLRVAEVLGAEIVSLDSMLVYRGLDVGTAKPSAAERSRAPHHLIDVAGPEERYDVQRYLADAEAALAGIRARGAAALFVGGTGFYLKALTHGVFDGPPSDPAVRARLAARAEEVGPETLHAELAAVDATSAARLHPNDVRRVVRALEVHAQTGRALSDWQREWRDEAGERAAGRPRVLVGLALDLADLERRIEARTRAMLAAGWAEEAARVRAGPGFGPTAGAALGYAEVLRHVDGELDGEECVRLVCLRTRQLAKRQQTWWRHFPELAWIDAPRDDEDVERAAVEVLRALERAPG